MLSLDSNYGDETLLTIANKIVAIANMPGSKIKLIFVENKIAVSCNDVNDFAEFIQDISENIRFELLRINKIAKNKANLLIERIKKPSIKCIEGENIYYWSWLICSKR